MSWTPTQKQRDALAYKPESRIVKEAMRYATDGEVTDFVVYIAVIDAIVLQKAGVSVHDLSDQPFADWFEDGLSPVKAAITALLDER